METTRAIKVILAALDLPQTEAALRAGIPEGYLRQVLNDFAPLSEDVCKKLGKVITHRLVEIRRGDSQALREKTN